MALALGTLLFGTVGAGWLIGKVGVSSTFMAPAVLLDHRAPCPLFLDAERLPARKRATASACGQCSIRRPDWMHWAGC